MTDFKNFIEFRVNGEKQLVENKFGLETTLNEYIRDVLKLKGTKVNCHEGGCGVCIVNGTYFDLNINQYKTIAINSCLFPLYSCDNWDFTTVEGIGCKSKKLHPIQKRLADYNGSQCGYCSPGFVMSMYSLLSNDPKPDKQTIENAFDGNICRCTGYRSILDAMKSFAVNETPIDIEDLNKIKCLNKSNHVNNDIKCNNISDMNTLVHHLHSKWYSPSNIQDFMDILEKSKSENYKLIAGDTMKCLFKTEGHYETYINVLKIKALYQVSENDIGFTIGSNITLTKLIEIFENKSKNNLKFDYLFELSKLISKVGNTPVRNVSTWCGNLVLKHKYQFFPSDLFIAFKTVEAVLTIKSKTEEIKVNLDEFLKINLKNKFVYSITFPPYNKENTLIKVFKVMPRSQNSHAYVTAGFKFSIDKDKFIVKEEPKLIIGGIINPYFESKSASNYLIGKELKSNDVFKESCKLLDLEMNGSDKNYEKSLAIALYYKFALTFLPHLSDLRITNAVESLIDKREISHGIQRFPTTPELYPFTQPIPKTNSYAQTSGEAIYNTDLPASPGQLNGAFILSGIGNCQIDSINFDKALLAQGVKKIIFAKDIPGENSITPFQGLQKQELFASNYIAYAGQPLGLVIAETEAEARYAAGLVDVTYKDLKKPILSIKDAIESNIFHSKVFEAFKKGDALEAIEKAPIKIKGEFTTEAQYHFFLENHIAVCTPNEDVFEIDCSTQWADYVQKAVAQVLNIQNHGNIEVKTKQLGGGFGGKSSHAALNASAAAVASFLTGKSVRVNLDLNTNMKAFGKRHPAMFKYEAGVDENGKLLGIKIIWYYDAGHVANNIFVENSYPFFDNAYFCPAWHIQPILVKTNTPVNSAMRSPYTFPAITATEYILDHIAVRLEKDPLHVRQINLYKETDLTIIGQTLKNYNLNLVLETLKKTADYENRLKEIEDFNKANRWKKRGLSILPLRNGVKWKSAYYSAIVNIFSGDGSVMISHSGIEMGQGLNTKVAQICAYTLGIPIETVILRSTNTSFNPNAWLSGGSITTELITKAVIECCNILNNNLEPVRKKMPENYTWKELITKSFELNVDLTGRYWLKPDHSNSDLLVYDVYAAGCSEVMIDVLTGENQLLRTDILYDCGQTANGLIDIGQAEGAFIMGYGFWFLEKINYNKENGRCITSGTWDYFPPASKDIPIDFRVSFLENSKNPIGVLGAKCIGEPPLCLSLSPLFACKRAIEAARADAGNTEFFNLNGPVTPDIIQRLALANYSDFAF